MTLYACRSCNLAFDLDSVTTFSRPFLTITDWVCGECGLTFRTKVTVQVNITDVLEQVVHHAAGTSHTESFEYALSQLDLTPKAQIKDIIRQIGDDEAEEHLLERITEYIPKDELLQLEAQHYKQKASQHTNIQTEFYRATAHGELTDGPRFWRLWDEDKSGIMQRVQEMLPVYDYVPLKLAENELPTNVERDLHSKLLNNYLETLTCASCQSVGSLLSKVNSDTDPCPRCKAPQLETLFDPIFN